ncbi:SDR family oxidoreductase [Citrobacter braakii]|uniref:SDR family oxidoreductase n=1 Tax=Citrobacter braakii TaxID=57706 RepID=UPI000CDE538F|nr:SDR family oxidoreductase [Citrobacter braakii]POT29219.1 NAD(P)-dependent dehydrogenase [Citrobacter braakii]POT34078.1 NAD(P)-dependent dehydrogenase [Citrobacter braakii]POT38903.1 NAD(P)-dependent dehydrogenase [Citrobacter braakii]POU80446.1 NAD(P)-dependent dehydrogenase [Citrobacter braakii]POV06422.1 NAD(P)-dependent dehydrogenase [Citrobacter braakii]
MMNKYNEKQGTNMTNSERFPVPPFPHQKQPFPGLAGKMQPRPDHGEESYQGRGRLTDRKVLITGGDSGIGRAVAIAFAREGADVAINYLPDEEEDAREVVDLIQKAGRKAVALPGDIREETFCQHLVSQVVKTLGGLDILINNAGRQQFCESIEELTTDAFDATFKTNVYSLFWITKAAVHHLPPRGVIINTSSVQAYEPSEILLDYAQTKAAIVAFTKSLAKQLAPKGIRVNAVAPGPYWTVLQCCGGQPQEKIEQFGASSPLGRPGQPVEIAPLYVTLASPENSYTSGQVWCSDGGTGTL